MTSSLFNLELVQKRRSTADRTQIDAYAMDALTERLSLIARSFSSSLQLDLMDPPLPYESQSFDLVTSLLSLQWVSDVPGLLSEINRILVPDGFFTGVFIGGDSLIELRDCLSQAELELSNGISPRLSPMIGVKDAGTLLQRAGFALPVSDKEKKTVLYRSSSALLSDLKSLGERNALTSRPSGFPPRHLFDRCFELYSERYLTAEGYLPLTIEFIYVSGWRPHPSQQQPLLPGSGTISLKILEV